MSVELRHILHRLGLGQYLPILLDNGFDSWDVLCDITEQDLTLLGVKLGHRRTLQREITSCRGLQCDQPASSEKNSRGQTPPSQYRVNGNDAQQSTQPEVANARQKRRYRRKPRPDVHAPQKPKTAYVNFANAQRRDPEFINLSLSFEESAREVGRRWQTLGPDSKHAWERQAAQAFQEYEAQMDEYKKTENYRRYQSYLRRFRQDSAQVSRQPPSNEPACETSSHSSESVAGANANSQKKTRHDSTHSTIEDCRASVALAVQELRAKRIELLAAGVPFYDTLSLPPEETVRKGAQCCIVGTGCIIYLVSSDQLDAMLDQVFRPGPVDQKSLIIALVIAATGAHYDCDCMPEPIRQGLYASAIWAFEYSLSKFNDYSIMQFLLLFSVYSLLEKHMAIRHIIIAGLKISRWKFPTLEEDLPERTDQKSARKVMNTLIFMDCWLSTTLGYKSDVSVEDLKHAWIPPCECTSINDAIHAQGSKIGLVSRDIAELTVHQAATDVRAEHISRLTEKLDAWYNELPPSMHLSILIDQNKYSVVNFFQRRAILMLHMFYLGAIISLYRQVLLNASNARIQSRWNLDVAYTQVQDYRARCSMAAQQMTRIMSLIDFTSFMTRRCWVLIYWSFHSCTVILFNSAQQILDGDHNTAHLTADLASAKLCIDTLDNCAQAEPVAAKHLALIQPLYEALAKHHQQNRATTATSTSAPTSYFQPQQQHGHHKDHAALSASPPGSSSTRSTVSTPASTMSSSSSSANNNLVMYKNGSGGSSNNITPLDRHQQQQPPQLDSEVVSIAKKLGELLANPFGMGIEARVEGVRREGETVAGTYSVLWWK
ncbi:hypothetical protein IWX90DRAFT_422134 [Phyllosticta citrichinensis]|uniref:HMG box domain-containing protein n=1 Tax=Phyllosticta citrichinensis TaxID=1130410 RepID=A0ABR1Y7H5_9PEZI